jgi:hypothetical protein
MTNQRSLFDADTPSWAGGPSISPGVPPADKARTSAQRQAILDRLRQGTATNIELYAIALNASARISELRKLGYGITARRVGQNGVFEYRLVGPI